MNIIKNKHMHELLALCSLEHTGTFESILAATQKQWLLSTEPPAEGTTYPLHEQTRIKLLAQKLGYISEVEPQASAYDYAIILGGETLTMTPRFSHLENLWKKGIRFGAMVYHAGVHPMPDYDEYSGLTEAETMRLLWKQAHIQEKFPGIPQIFIDIPLVHGKHPTTADGVAYWLSLNPQPGSCLVISSQPYIAYQHAVFQTYMPTSFTIETVGSTCAASVEVSEILDSITRYLFQVKQGKNV